MGNRSISWKAEFDGEIKKTENAQKLKRIATKKKSINNAWKSKPLHGQYLLQSQKADLDLHHTHQWLRSAWLKGYLHYKTILWHYVALDVQLIIFFIWRKNNVLFLRYLDFCVFGKSAEFKICDVIISIAG